MAGETLDFKITVDAAQAQAEIAKMNGRISELEEQLKKANTATETFENRQRQASNVVDDIDRKVAKYQKDLDILSDAIVKGTGNTAAYTQQMRALERELDNIEGKQRQVTNTTVILSNAQQGMSKSGRNLGQDLLIISYAVDDLQYGLKGVINNVPQVVSAIAGPGSAGLAGAIGIAAVAASVLYDAFREDIPEATEEGTDAAKKYLEELTQAISDADEELSELVLGSSRNRISSQRMAVESAILETKNSREEFSRQFGIDPLNMEEMDRIASKAQGGMSLWVNVWNAQKKEMDQVRVAAKDIMAEYRKTTDAYNKAVDEQVLLSKFLAIEKEKNDQAAEDAAIKSANEITEAEEKEANKRAKNSEKKLKKEEEANAKWLAEAPERILKAREKYDQELEEQRDKEMQALIDDQEKWAKIERDIFKKNEEEKTKIKKEEDKKRKKIEEDTSDFYISIQQMLTSQLLASSSDYIQAKIEGEKDAERKAIAGFLKATGQQLVASGTRAVFEGIIANAAIPGSGVPLMTAGSAAIGAGVLMGAGGAKIMPQEPPKSKEAQRERGASSFSGRSSRGGGGTNLTIVYGGISGPTADQGSRALMSAWSRARRRGYA